jgi:RNA:NAD 2'-phosphotransferase (TPT1/KptA family)
MLNNNEIMVKKKKKKKTEEEEEERIHGTVILPKKRTHIHLIHDAETRDTASVRASKVFFLPLLLLHAEEEGK